MRRPITTKVIHCGADNDAPLPRCCFARAAASGAAWEAGRVPIFVFVGRSHTRACPLTRFVMKKLGWRRRGALAYEGEPGFRAAAAVLVWRATRR